MHQWSERPTYEVLGDRLRRIERAGGLSDARSGPQHDVRRADRFVVEQGLVDGPQLLHAQIAIRDPFAPSSV